MTTEKQEEELPQTLSFAPAGPEVNNYKWEGRALPNGWWPAVLKKCAVVASKKSGLPQIKAMFGVDGGPDGGVAIFHYVPLKPCGFRSTFLEGLGLQKYDKSNEAADVREWVGLETQVKIRNEKNLYGEDAPKIADMKFVKGVNEPSRRHPAITPPKGEFDDGDVPFDTPE